MNNLHERRQRDLRQGEAADFLRYLQIQAAKNPPFYYEIQLDVAERITNVFWADARMIFDYGYFGDVVSFDSTFLWNKKYRPFACFHGFNHHRETVIFGAALMYDETAASFEWLFKTFLHAMSGKKPLTIFTSQNVEVVKAVSQVMPETYHGLSLSHLMQQNTKHLGNLSKDGSNFSLEFRACVNLYEEDHKLFQAWDLLLDKYNLRDSNWMKEIWAMKEKWAHVYMKRTFTAGMRSTQLRGRMKSSLRGNLKSDNDIVGFFNHLNLVLNDLRYKEAKADCQAGKKIPRLKMKTAPMLVQAERVYTPPIFELFQKEYVTSTGAILKHCNESGKGKLFVFGLYEQERGYTYTVLGNPKEQTVSCNCRKFEKVGILCSHALKVLDLMEIKQMPESYILRRWRKDARDEFELNIKAPVNEEDPKLAAASRYRILYSKMLQIAAIACQSEATYQLVYGFITDMQKQLDNMIISQNDVVRVAMKVVPPSSAPQGNIARRMH